MSYRILLVGGGSGGHVYPLVAVEKSLREKARASSKDLEILFIGDNAAKVAAESGIKFKRIIVPKFRRYFSIYNFIDLFKIPLGILQSFWHIFWFMPDVILAKGSHVSFFPSVIAKIYFIPLVVHESDSIPGLTNRILSRIANTVLVSFPNSEKYMPNSNTILTGNPVREELMNGDKNQAMRTFHTNDSRKTILVMGGSQGARKINDALLKSLAQITEKYFIIHQCGPMQFKSVQNELERIINESQGRYDSQVRDFYKIYPLLDSHDLSLAYAAADAIISRGGSSSIFEIAQLGKPAIIIPMTNSANNHQYQNALEFSKFGAVIVEESNLAPRVILNQLDNILKPENHDYISNEIKKFAKPDAADRIAEIILGS